MNSGEQKIYINREWDAMLHEEIAKPYFAAILSGVDKAYLSGTVFPPSHKVFRAFTLCAPKDARVVILGQDPYHTPGVADGLAFSSRDDNPVPPSLRNIYKEIESEFGVKCGPTPDLTHWAKQGVLLLNASLTVLSGTANSHVSLGWHEFTDAVITTISRECDHVVFMLWGSYAHAKRELINSSKHLVLESPHPSPLSAHRGFLGNGHFRKANEYLKANSRGEIGWC